MSDTRLVSFCQYFTWDEDDCPRRAIEVVDGKHLCGWHATQAKKERDRSPRQIGDKRTS